MKRKYVFSAAMTLFIAVSCSVTEPDVITKEAIVPEATAKEIIITAGVDESGETKTILNSEGKVEWLPGDEMSLFSAGEMAKFTSINTESARSANFRGVITFITGANEGSDPEAFVYGLYPYDEDATMSAGVITTTIPAAQVGYPDSFGDDLALSVAKSTSLNLNFKNAYSGIDFEFSETGYTSVTLSSNNGELIAGTVNVSFDGSGIPSVAIASGSSSITLTAPGGGSFETGKRYYIVCAPQTLAGGFTLTAYKPAGHTEFRVASRQVFERNTFKYLTGNLNERGTYYIDKITFADAQLKNKLVTAFDTNGDGELSVLEAEAVTDSDAFKDAFGVEEHNYSSFDEFRYFTGLTTISSETFKFWSNLSSIVIPSTITSIGSESFLACTNLSSIDIPEGISSIEDQTFNGCYTLTSITFPESLTTIGMGAFLDCQQLTTIVLPSGITSIGDIAFYGCTKLTNLTIKASSVPTGIPSSAFDGLYPIFVPSESVDDYKSDTMWSSVAERIFAIPELVDLGLSVKWAKYNLGASSPEEYGNYYAWGEVKTKNGYTWTSYKWCNGTSSDLTKYNNKEAYGTIDQKLVLDSSDDVASVILGGNWRIPTKAELQELAATFNDKTNYQWTALGKKSASSIFDGWQITRITGEQMGNSIIIPAAGYWDDDSTGGVREYAVYWSTSLDTGTPSKAWYIDMNASGPRTSFSSSRYRGYPIRPVCD